MHTVKVKVLGMPTVVLMQADKAAEDERERRMEEEKEEFNLDRSKVYDRLVTVQEDLLKTFHRMKVHACMNVLHAQVCWQMYQRD